MIRTLSALVLALAATLCGASERPIQLADKAPVQHIVVPGDTLWGIVDRYRDLYAPDTYILDYKEEIMECNPGLRERHGQISPGDVIKIKVKNGRV